MDGIENINQAEELPVPCTDPVVPDAPEPEMQAQACSQACSLPPPYSPFPVTHESSSELQWTGPATAGTATYVPRGKRLGHMDFVPRIVQKRLLKEDLYETFSDLIQRVNAWLEEHPGLDAVSCETITWFGNNYKEIFSDSCVCNKFTDMFATTTFVRGLRLWYITDIIPCVTSTAKNTQVIQCRTFVATLKERFNQLVNRVNQAIANQKTKIMKVEMIRVFVRDGFVSTDATYWKESGSEKKVFVWALRIFSFLLPDENKETIGYQDFIPECMKRSRENKGYEVFSDVMDKASRWIAYQRNVRFVNIQTISVKVKKDPQFEERCKFTERGTNPTPYLKLSRVFYVISSDAERKQEWPAVRLSYRTFIPGVLASDSKSYVLNYESMQQVVERINSWLHITGAQLFGMETVGVVMSSSLKLQMLGSEATFETDPVEDGGSCKHLFHVRVYLDGDYVEPPGATSLVIPPQVKYVIQGMTPSHVMSTGQMSPVRYLSNSNSSQRLA